MRMAPPEPQGFERPLRELLTTGTLRPEDALALRDAGFGYVAFYPRYLPAPDKERLTATFGPPVAETDTVWVFALR